MIKSGEMREARARDRIIASILIVAQMAAYLPAEPLLAGRRAGAARLEQYLDRAGKERDVSQWEAISTSGLAAALAEWEAYTLYYKETDREGWEAEREAAEGAYRAEREKRYAEWFTDRYYEEAAKLERSGLRAALRGEAAAWEYEKDGEKTRQVGGEDAGDAAAQWEEDISAEIVEAYMAKWEAAQGSAQSEIMGRLRERGISEEELGALIGGRAAAYRGYVRREYEKVAMVEENALLRVLLYDTESLRKRSEGEAARVIAEALAAEAREETGKAADELFGELETVLESRETEEARIESLNGWLEEFRRTFEKGLAEWEEAEGRFLVARSEWEKEASEIYINSEQVWADAYAQLRGERKAWEEKLQGKLDEGVARWRGESEALAEMLEEARGEFESAALEERTRIEQNIDREVTLYTQSRDMVAMAFEGLNYWYEKWAGKYNGVYSYWKTEPEKYGQIEQIAGIETEAGGNKSRGTDWTAASQNTDTARIREELGQWKQAYIEGIRKEYGGGTAALEGEEAGLRVAVGALESLISDLDTRDRDSYSYTDAVRLVAAQAQLAATMGQLAVVRQKLVARKDAGKLEKLNSLEAGMSGAAFTAALEALGVAGYREGITGDEKAGETWKAGEELLGWLELIDRYEGKAEGALEALFRISGGIFDAEGVWEYYDELEIELLKAQAAARYWKNEVSIAEEVYEYSADVTSKEQAAGETEGQLREAKEAYEEALWAYEGEAAALGERYKAIGEANEGIKAVRAELEKKRAAVEAARRAYGVAYAAERGVSVETLQGLIGDVLLEVLRVWEPGEDMRAAKEEAEGAYRRAVLAYGEAEQEKKTNEVIKGLINGDGGSMKSLGALRDIVGVFTGNGTVAGIVLKVTDIRLFPAEHEMLRKLMQEQAGVWNRGSATAGEKAVAKEILEEGWKIVKAYWEDEVGKREEAIRYIGTGESGIGAAVSAEEEAEGKLRYWLEGQYKAAALEIRLTDPGEGSDVRRMAALLEGLLSEREGESGATLRERVQALREDPLVRRILTEGVPVDGRLSGWATYEYRYLVNKSGIGNGERRASLEGQYGRYAYRAVNEADRAARGAVNAYIEENAGNLTMILNDRELLYGYVKGLREAGAGLNAAGQDGLNEYIGSLMKYTAAKLAARGDPGLKGLSAGSAKGALEGAYEAAGEYEGWAAKARTLGGLLEIIGSARFGALGEGKDVFYEAAAYYLIGEGPHEIRECGSAAEVIGLIGSLAAGEDGEVTGKWALVFGELRAEAQAGIGEAVAGVFRKGAEEARYEQALEWLKLEAGSPERDASKYAGNALIEAIRAGEAKQGAYEAYEVMLASAIENGNEEDVAEAREGIERFDSLTGTEWFTGWAPYYLAGADGLYVYLLSPGGYGDAGGLEKLATLGSDGAAKADSVRAYYRKQGAVESYVEMLDGDADAWVERYRVPGAAGDDAVLSLEEKAEVLEAIRCGSGTIGTVYNAAEMRERVKPSLTMGTSAVLSRMQREAGGRASGEAAAQLQGANEELLRLQTEWQFAQYAEEERAQSSTEWIGELKKSGLGSLSAYTAEEREKIKGILEGGSAFGEIEGRLLREIGEAGARLTGEEAALSTALFEDMAALLARGSGYDGISRDVENAVKELGAAKQGLAAAGGDTGGSEKRISELLGMIKEFNGSKAAKEAALGAAKQALEDTERDYEKGADDYAEAVGVLQEASDAYNGQAEAVARAFAAAEEAKTAKRAAQGKYDWATSVYLSGFGNAEDGEYETPKEKLTEVLYAQRRADAAVDVLRGMKEGPVRGEMSGEYDAALEAYKDGAERYYRARAIEYDAALEIARLEDVVRAAEKEDREKLAALVREDVVINGRGPPSVDLVHIVYNESTGGYDITLGGGTKDAGTVEEYFTDREEKGVAFALVDAPENRKTQAAVDTLTWLEGVMRAGGQGYLTELGLAALYLKTVTGKLDGYDPGKDEGISASIGVEKLHGYEIGEAYTGHRLTVLGEAYGRIAGSGAGQADLARYLLYRDTTLVPLELQRREEQELKSRALDRVLSDIQARVRGHSIAGDIAMGIGAGLTASAVVQFLLPLGTGIPAAGKLLALAAAAFVLGGIELTKARDLGDMRGLVGGVKDGIGGNRNALLGKGARALGEWQEARSYYKEVRAKLDRYYGKRPDGEDELTYGSFITGLSEILDTSKGPVSPGEMQELYPEEVYRASGAQRAEGTAEAMKRLRVYLKDRETRGLTTLDETQGVPLQQGQNGAIERFNAAVAEDMVIPEAKKKELRALALKASDIRLSVAERKAASDEYDALVESYIGEASVAGLKARLQGEAETAYGAGSWYQRGYDRAIIGIYEERFEDAASAYAKYSRPGEEYIGDSLVNGLREAALAALGHAAAAQREVKYNEWALVQKEFSQQMDDWFAQMNIIIRKSHEEWAKAEGKINSEYFAWRENFAATYNERDTEWRENYQAFLQDKDDWMTEQYLYAANYANYGILKESGTDVTRVIAQSLNTALGKGGNSLKDQGFDADGYIDGLLADTNLAALMGYAGSLTDRGTGSAGAVKRGIKRTTDTGSMLAARAALEGISTERRAVAARLAAEQAKAQLKEAQESYKKRLRLENEGMREWEEHLVREDGYTVSGNNISRQMIVNSTLFSNVKNTQTVHMYQDFYTADAKISVDLDAAALEGIDEYAIMLMVSQAQRDMQKWSEDIFGRVDEEGNTLNRDIPRSLGEASTAEYARVSDGLTGGEKAAIARMAGLGSREGLSDGEKEEYHKLSVRYASLRDGELGRHIGYAPVFKAGKDLDPDKGRSGNVASYGIGQMGAIMLDFQWNSIEAGRGLQALALPMYDKTLWDDRSVNLFRNHTLFALRSFPDKESATVNRTKDLCGSRLAVREPPWCRAAP